MTRARAALRAVGPVAALALLGACGLPQSSTPVQIPKAEVPYGLLDAAPTSTVSPSSTPGVPVVSANVYLANAQQQLVAVSVQVPNGQAAPMLQSLLNRLLVGPTERERDRGLLTDLGPGSTIVVRNLSAGLADIELQSEQDATPSKLPVAVGQIVLTATSIVGVDRVVFSRDGAQVPVPGPDGSSTSTPLVAADYTGLLANDQGPITRTVPLPGAAAATATTAG